METINDKNLRLGVFGTRTFTSKKIEKRIIKEIEKLNPSYILTAGDAKGACELAIQAAKKLSIPAILYWLNRKKYARGCFNERSKLLYKNCDFVLLFHDGISKGTLNELNLAKQMKVPYKYIKLKQDKKEMNDSFIDGLDNDFLDKPFEEILIK